MFCLFVNKVNVIYFPIRNSKRKQPYLFTLDKEKEKQIDFDFNCLLVKLQSSQLVFNLK